MLVVHCSAATYEHVTAKSGSEKGNVTLMRRPTEARRYAEHSFARYAKLAFQRSGFRGAACSDFSSFFP